MCNENGCMGDEFRFLMICKEYQADRIEFCRKIYEFIVPFGPFTRQEQFPFLMSTIDTVDVFYI